MTMPGLCGHWPPQEGSRPPMLTRPDITTKVAGQHLGVPLGRSYVSSDEVRARMLLPDNGSYGSELRRVLSGRYAGHVKY